MIKYLWESSRMIQDLWEFTESDWWSIRTYKNDLLSLRIFYNDLLSYKILEVSLNSLFLRWWRYGSGRIELWEIGHYHVLDWAQSGGEEYATNQEDHVQE